MSKLDANKMAALLAQAQAKKKEAEQAKLSAALAFETTGKNPTYPNAPILRKEPTPQAAQAATAATMAEKLAAIRAKKEAEREAAIKEQEQRAQAAAVRADILAAQATPTPAPITSSAPIAPVTSSLEQLEQEAEEANKSIHIDKYGNAITYNPQQQEFVNLVGAGESCILIGAAGTGKTTCSQGGLEELISSGRVPVLAADGHRHLVDGTPGVVIIAYTRRAVNNIKRVLPANLKHNAITAHKLLEYGPVKETVTDPETGEDKTIQMFRPSRDQHNPLPTTIHTVVVEEASMMSTQLFAEISAALPHEVQWVFLGDINQLPPVFGPAILGFKMLELPVIELTQVYRQALESPIIRLAHRILSGNTIPAKEFPEWNIEGKLTLHPWKKKLAPHTALATLAAFFTKAYDSGVYEPDEDTILIPYNKSCGTEELNKHIANHLARKHGRTTYEVVAGFNKLYFSPGDRVLYDKEDAEILEINNNAAYTGARFQHESMHLDYWGYNSNAGNEKFSQNYGTDDVDFLLAQVEAAEDRVTQCSHKIKVRLLDTGTILEVTKAADVNNMLHAYVLTVHKAQGSEWRKVFLALHQSHATMLQRELLYTAVTRAREELYVICEPESLVKGINSQRIKGDTLAEKAQYFKGKVRENEEYIK